MLPTILYAMPIGAICSLFYTIIFNIPKLIRFIAKMLTKGKDKEE